MGETSATKRFPRAWLLLAIMAGGALGLGGYTFHYAEGTSYLSTDPKACVNCHIMRPQYDSWQQASHHTSAGCVDCHLPASGIEKWIAKADNGYRHSKAFTFQDFPEPIRITAGNAEILQNNCVRCHSDLVHELVTGFGGDIEPVSCVHCHSSVGHGVRAGLGGRDLGIEEEMR